MANSPAQTDRPPFQQLQTVVDLLDTPTLARLYANVRENGPVTVADVVADQDIPQRVYEELGGDPDVDEDPSSDIPYPHGFEEGWIIVADDLTLCRQSLCLIVARVRSTAGLVS